ncbi:hypothetical protein [Dactylosporangium sp. NPDC005555]|uniref:hypothetical protein n=1 Tax=Dactylosporangium sp. NPDC005555 TaxID=3154889 RepID=UPI0033B3CA54
MQITELTELARALLGERPSGRDVVPAQVAERISRLAAQWAANGFTAATVRPWVDLSPPSAAVLAKAGTTPEALERHVITTAGTTTTLWRAVAAGTMSAEEAVAALAPAAAPAPASASAVAAQAGTFSGAAAGPAGSPAVSSTTPGQSRGASRNAFSASAPEVPGAYRAAPGAARPAAETFKAPPQAPADEVEETTAPAKVAPAVFSHPAAETVADTDDRRRRSAPPQTPFST